MKRTSIILSSALISALIAAPVFASKNDDDDDRKARYKEYYMQRHQMNMDMMQMLSETMTILSNLNHMPSAKEKQRLNDMIKQLNEMMETRKEMWDKAQQRMMDGDDDGHHGRHHDS